MEELFQSAESILDEARKSVTQDLTQRIGAVTVNNLSPWLSNTKGVTNFYSSVITELEINQPPINSMAVYKSAQVVDFKNPLKTIIGNTKYNVVNKLFVSNDVINLAHISDRVKLFFNEASITFMDDSLPNTIANELIVLNNTPALDELERIERDVLPAMKSAIIQNDEMIKHLFGNVEQNVNGYLAQLNIELNNDLVTVFDKLNEIESLISSDTQTQIDNINTDIDNIVSGIEEELNNSYEEINKALDNVSDYVDSENIKQTAILNQSISTLSNYIEGKTGNIAIDIRDNVKPDISTNKTDIATIKTKLSEIPGQTDKKINNAINNIVQQMNNSISSIESDYNGKIQTVKKELEKVKQILEQFFNNPSIILPHFLNRVLTGKTREFAIFHQILIKILG